MATDDPYRAFLVFDLMSELGGLRQADITAVDRTASYGTPVQVPDTGEPDGLRGAASRTGAVMVVWPDYRADGSCCMNLV